MKIAAMAAAVAVCVAAPVWGQERSPAPDDAFVYIVAPLDGATVTNPVTIVFGLDGMGVAPAGIEVADTGHHHLLINVDPASLPLDEGIPSDDMHRHFGGGQTQVTLDLPAGTHTLALMLGDHFHLPHDPPIYSEMVTITVQ